MKRERACKRNIVLHGATTTGKLNDIVCTGSSYDVFISDAGGLASVKLGLEAAVPAPSFPGGVIRRCFEDDSEYQKCDKRFDRYPGGPGDRGSERRRSSGLRKPMYLTLHRTIFPCVRVNFTA